MTINNTRRPDLFENLKTNRVTAELKNLEWKSGRAVLVKTIFTSALIIIGLAAAALLSSSTFFLGISIGGVILSAYMIYHHTDQHKQLTKLFNTAKTALRKI